MGRNYLVARSFCRWGRRIRASRSRTISETNPLQLNSSIVLTCNTSNMVQHTRLCAQSGSSRYFFSRAMLSKAFHFHLVFRGTVGLGALRITLRRSTRAEPIRVIPACSRKFPIYIYFSSPIYAVWITCTCCPTSVYAACTKCTCSPPSIYCMNLR